VIDFTAISRRLIVSPRPIALTRDRPPFQAEVKRAYGRCKKQNARR
jgi:hypothetical protein